MATTRNEQHEGADGEDELTRSAAREGPESVQAAQFAKMLVPGLGPYRVVAEFVEFVPVQVELAPCGPRASTTRPTSTTTSPPASATTGRDSTGCLRALRKGDVLVVWKLDRLGRNLAHLVNTVQDLSARGVGLRVLTGQGAQIDTTTAAGRLVFGIFEALAEFERELIRERTVAGLKAARARGRRGGGRKFALSKAQVRLAQAAMEHRDTSVSALCRELGIRPVTLYRYVGPQGQLREQGQKVLAS